MLFEKPAFPWLDGIHPSLRDAVLAAKRRRDTVTYDAEGGTLTIASRISGPLASSREVYDAASGEPVMRARS